jgi:arylsulfatase A-like enzyme/Tfp pilus assembly protein PilF
MTAATATPPVLRARPSLVLITLDTTRADRLGAWGRAEARTPNLDALAERGVRFERCDSSSPMTLPSHASLLTGLYPPRHGVRDNGSFRLAAEHETLAELLSRDGYDTGAVVAATVLAGGYGLGQGFRVYDDDMGAGHVRPTPIVERRAEETTTAALALLESLRRPFFLWVHYFDPHDDYRAPPRAGSGYDGELTYMDEQLGRLLEALPEESVAVVVGDHGEMLGEFGETGHGLLPFAGARRVPLLIAGPEVPAGRVVTRLVRTVDVAPTILGLAGVGEPLGLDGRGLLPLDVPAEPVLSYWESFYPFFAFRWYPLRALSDGERLYVHGPEPGLYDARNRERSLTADGAEVNKWKVRLEELLGKMGAPVEAEVVAGATASRARQLESLGYLSGAGGGRVHRALPDPREMTAVARFLQEAAGGVDRGECGELTARIAEILDRQPENPAARILAGRCLLRSGDAAGALAHFRTVAGEPSSLVLGLMGEALRRLGRNEEAEAAWRSGLSIDPADGHVAAYLARSLRRRGQVGAAEEVADTVLTAGARLPVLYFERGMARMARDEPQAALEDFEEAARRDPRQREPLANAAQVARSLGQPARAARLYERLVRLEPDRAELWSSLGDLYRGPLAEREQAIRCFQRALALEETVAGRRRLEAILEELKD